MPEGVVEISEVPYEELLVYDAGIFPAARPQFLKCWIEQPEGIALAVIEDRRLAGYGVIRKCRTGYKIGPLFANTEHIAENLFAALKSHVPGEAIFLDTPLSQPGGGGTCRTAPYACDVPNGAHVLQRRATHIAKSHIRREYFRARIMLK